MLHVNPLSHVEDLGVGNHRRLVLDIIRLDLPVLHPVRDGEGNTVDRLQSALRSPVLQKETLLETPELDVLHGADGESCLLGLHHLQAGQGGVGPAASRPLLVIGVVNLHPRAEVLAKLRSVCQVRSVRSEAALGEVGAEAPGVGAPRDALLHHRGVLNTPVLPSLGCEVLREANRIGHLLVSELQQLSNRSSGAWGAPAARALSWTAGLPNSHRLPHRHVIAHGHRLKHLHTAEP
mmetsp:Transcript_93796/g.201387  ORF Transcript_93796/g.201387 Transcript_93796/m.201387 type:complete len:236 (+) Transcript_93796:343-1050(+)